MSLPYELPSAFDELMNRLTAECILAVPGRDEGLLPTYSLLGELCELCGGIPPLHEPLTMVYRAVEALLDSLSAFEPAIITRLHQLVDWLPVAATYVRTGEPVPLLPPPPSPAVVAAAATSDDAPAAPVRCDDELLHFDLEPNRELLTEFYGEAHEHLQQIEAALLVLDEEPGNRESLAAIFRSYHTIKGNAGFLGLRPMHLLAHEVESLLDLARNGALRLNQTIISEILRSRDALHALNQQVAAALESGRPPDVVVPVSHLLEVFRALAVCDAVKPAPGGEARSPDSTPDSLFISPAAPRDVPPAGAHPEAAAGNSAALAGVSGASSGTATASAATVRVSTEKLDSLMDVVGELVIVQSQLVESARVAGQGVLQRNLTQLGRITKELQHTALSLRMIPIKSTFQKMERLARDLARQCEKRVVFSTSGEETELDRTVVEQIGDPLVHMVRNALDHGVESASERLEAGKPEAGTVHLKAYHQGSNIVIELQDDGRGLDPEKLLRKAIEKGIVAAGAQLSRDEIHALIFAPGFSTAEKVTAVSGRGVGMDVVKRNIEKLRGNVEISSERGRGSVFKIKLPLTMAIIDGLVVRVGADRFVLPSTSVQLALRPTREQVSNLHGQGEVLELRGRLLPIHRLHRQLGIPGDAQQPWDGIVVVVESSGKTSALMVDEMVTKQEVVVKGLGALMRHVRGVSGGAILGDGSIALILDPGTLLNAA